MDGRDLAQLEEGLGTSTELEINNIDEMAPLDPPRSAVDLVDDAVGEAIGELQFDEHTGEEPRAATTPVDDPLSVYLNQIGKIPLLSREREIKLARDVE